MTYAVLSLFTTQSNRLAQGPLRKFNTMRRLISPNMLINKSNFLDTPPAAGAIEHEISETATPLLVLYYWTWSPTAKILFLILLIILYLKSILRPR